MNKIVTIPMQRQMCQLHDCACPTVIKSSYKIFYANHACPRLTGLGARGAGIVSRLLQSSTIDSEHAWYVDAEECGKHLARAPTRLQLSYEVCEESHDTHHCKFILLLSFCFLLSWPIVVLP
jgi:hypothetical protein